MDYEQWLFVRHIGATGYVRTHSKNSLLQPASQHSIQFWRQQLDQRLSTLLADNPMMGVIKALVMGARGDISKRQWEVFQRTGTTHLVAISGLHIGLVAGMVFFVTRRLWIRLGSLSIAPHVLAAWVALLMAVFYAALAGFSVPTQRAMIMVAVVMGSLVFRRKVLSFRLLFLALFLIVLWQPLVVLSPGFWLSFSAVGLILYVSMGRLKEVTTWLALQRVHWIIAVGLSPLLLLFFQQVSVIAPVANVLAVPLISLIIVPGSLLGTALLWIWPSLGGFILQGLASILNGLWSVLSYLSDWPMAQWQQPQPPLWILVFSVLGILLLLAPKGIPARWLGAVLLLPALFQQSPKPGYGEMQLTLLDVGQGLAAVVQTAQHTLVFDTGARYSQRFDMGAAVISPFLRNKGIAAIDMLIVSHGDSDHKGGARSLSRQFDIRQTLSSVPQQLSWLHAKPCKAGSTWLWDGVEFRILVAESDHLSSANDLSCVLQVKSVVGSLLLTGDIERGAERALIDQYGESLASDVLVVPHHGSRTSSTPAFIQQVNPRYALIPAGYKNRYRHPSERVMRRYQAFSIETLNTADQGAIEINFSAHNGVSSPKSYRYSHGHYWNAGMPVQLRP